MSPHPTSTPGAANRIEVEATLGPGGALELRYRLSGAIEAISIAGPAAPERTDSLWQHTCFEAFVRAGRGYCEFNFAPSSRWAAYRFSGYRKGMAPLDIAPPAIDWWAVADEAELRVSLILPADATGPFGFSAVIEETNGAKSYWALAHPAGKPDFHHGDCFTLDLPLAHPSSSPRT